MPTYRSWKILKLPSQSEPLADRFSGCIAQPLWLLAPDFSICTSYVWVLYLPERSLICYTLLILDCFILPAQSRDNFTPMKRVTTRLTRELDNVWLLELVDPASPNFRCDMSDKPPIILQILSKIEGRRLIIDLTCIPNFDTCGIEFLCLLHQQFVGRNFHLMLRNPNSYTQEILQRTQLDQVFELE